MSSVHDAVAQARHRLRVAGIRPVEADLDARLLAQFALGWGTERFLADARDPQPAGFAERYEALVARREAREPLPYLIGRREFWNLTFEVTPAVLIPRPETELIVETALELFPDREAPIRIADACTGCGCLAAALALERPRALIVATDLSAAALEVARGNFVRHRVAGRVRTVQTDLLDGIEGRFDLIVANPPYVSERDRPALQPEVRDYEPSIALYGGRDGLAIVRRLVDKAAAHLEPGGMLLFECGYWQNGEVTELIAAAPGLTMVDFKADLRGVPRTAVARRDSPPPDRSHG
jgi:release factor glutamine methyltransferase